jgi:hypothetical protein
MELKIEEHYNVGKVKYLVSYYTGKKHDDGSDFYDVKAFSNKKFKDRFVGLLQAHYYEAKHPHTNVYLDIAS